MKVFLLVLILVLSLFFARAQAKRYVVEPGNAQLSWTGYGEVGGYSLTGTLPLKSGSFWANGVVISKGVFWFDMTRIVHENKTLVHHLKDKDFFYVRKYPVAVFELSGVQNGTATGFITIRNIKKPIRFPVDVKVSGTQLQVSGQASIDRTQFEIYYNSNSFFQNLGNNAIKNNFDFRFSFVSNEAG